MVEPDPRAESVTVPARYNGPPESGNGGYTAGLVAALLPGAAPAVRVTLRQPPPLATPLRVARDCGGVQVYDGGRLIAEAEAADPVAEAVAPVPYDRAQAASAGYPGFTDHPFPTCYVCGPQRAEGDGLRLFPGPLPDGRTATPWTVPQAPNPAMVWAALDCPGGWAVIAPGRPYVLGRITAQVHAMPRAGQRCVVTGAHAGGAGRKALVHSTLHDEDGTVLARAAATWIALPPQER